MASKNGRMLKDFLQDGTVNNSSTGFDSVPRRIPDNLDMATGNLSRSRSRSRAAAEAALGSFQKLLHAVKSIHYSSTTPSTLQRGVSRRWFGRLYMNKRSSRKSSGEVMSSKIVVVSVKVKDILRWRSFRDLAIDNNQVFVEEGAEEFQPLDFVGPANDAPSTNGSEMSWGESDFTAAEETAEECCLGDTGDAEGKKWDDAVVASDSGVGPKEDKHTIASEEDAEQQSPVSVLDSPFRDEVSDEELLSSFDQKMANMERTKQRLMQSIQWFENLAGVHEDDETDSVEEEEEEQQPKEENDEIEAKSRAYSSKRFCWFKRGRESLEDKKESLKGMEKQGQWIKFDEERTELGVELQVDLLSDLLGEVLVDFWM